jgi:capsular exopolysaccharide synthesis family protein
VETSAPTSFSRPLAETDLKLYLRILLQWLWLIILCTVVAAVTAYVVSLYSVPIYQATSTILIDEARNPSGPTYQDILTIERKARTYAEWMQRPQTLELVAYELGVDPLQLQEGVTSVTVTPVRDTQLLRVEVEGVWPEVIAAVANTLPNVFVQEVLKQLQDDRYAELESRLQQQLGELNSQIELIRIKMGDIGESRTAAEEVERGRLLNELSQRESTRNSLSTSLEQLQINKAQSSDTMIVVEQAVAPLNPVRPRALVNTLLAAIVGAMLALGIVFLVEYLDDRIKSPQDLQQLTSVPMVGLVNWIGGKRRKPLAPHEALISFLQPRHPWTEAIRSLRINLQFTKIDSSLDLLMVTSAVPGDGKTTVASNLAVVMAQAGRKVILIDGDLRKPRVHLAFGLPRSPGLTETLMAGPGTGAKFGQSTVVPNLTVLTSGESAPNPAELLGSQRMQQLLDRLREEADVVIVDAPPLLPVSDAQLLAATIKDVLLVVSLRRTQKSAMFQSLEALERVNANLLGIVANQARQAARGYYYGYGYRDYSDSYGDEPTETPPPPTAAPKPSPSHTGILQRFRRRNGRTKGEVAPAQTY